MERLNLHWLGLPIVELKGRPIKLETRKSLALLAYLSIGGQRCQREILATTFWPEGNQRRALACLRRTLSSLNTRLAEWIEADRETAGLRPGGRLRIDVVDFRGLLRRVEEHCGRPSAVCDPCRSILEQARDLYRGDFLEGLILGDSPDFDDWQAFERDSLRREFAVVLERLTACQAARSEWESAIDSAKRWARLDPLHEPASRALMDAYARSGQRSAALHHFEELERLLGEQQGRSPEEETRLLHQRIRGPTASTPASSGEQPRPGIPLLRTKLYVPTPPTSRVVRRSLLQQLAAVEAKALTLISAPAGFGKTTLLAEWIAESKLPVAWLSLDGADNDPHRFLRYVIAALQGLHPDLFDQARQLLQSDQPTPAGAILTCIINDLGKLLEPCALVLDDYQFITERSIHELTMYLLDHPAPSLHLVIATRADPPLQLGRLRGYKQMSELRTQDLRFTADEAEAFLNEVMQLGLSAEDVQALRGRTEGWVVGLQMAGLALRGCESAGQFVRDFSGTHRYVLDYLLEEVLKRQPAHIQSFLVATSILKKLTGPLCDALMSEQWRESGESGQAALEYLEANNLFLIALDDHKEWYRYHHLFADLLQSRLIGAGREKAAILHRRASEWYESEGLSSEAIEHAFAAQDIDRATALIERHAGDLIFVGGYSTVLAWLAKLPPTQIRRRPWLSAWCAWGLLASGKTEGVESCIADIEDASGDSPNEKAEATMRESQALSAELGGLRVTLASLRDEHETTIQLAEAALERVPAGDSRHRINILHPAGNAYYATGQLELAERTYSEVLALSTESVYLLRRIIATHKLCGIRRIMGDMNAAERTYAELMRTVEAAGAQEFFGMGFIYAGIGSILYEWNQLDAANEMIRRGVRLCEQTGVPMIEVDGRNSLVPLLIAQNDLDAADLALWKIHSLVENNPVLPESKEMFESLRVRYWMARGDLGNLETWCRNRQRAAPLRVRFQRELGDIALCRALIALGGLSEAATILDELTQGAEAGGRLGRLTAIYLVRAQLHQSQSDPDLALRWLQKSLAAGQCGNHIRTYLDAGDWLGALLERAAQETRTADPEAREYIEGLRNAFAHDQEVKLSRQLP